MNPLIWEQDRWNTAGGETRSSHYSGSLLRSCNSKTIVHARLQLKLQASICGFNNFFWWRFRSNLWIYRLRMIWTSDTTMIRQQEHEFKYTPETAIKSSFIPIFSSRRPLQCIKNVYWIDFIEASTRWVRFGLICYSVVLYIVCFPILVFDKCNLRWHTTQI